MWPPLGLCFRRFAAVIEFGGFELFQDGLECVVDIEGADEEVMVHLLGAICQ